MSTNGSNTLVIGEVAHIAHDGESVQRILSITLGETATRQRYLLTVPSFEKLSDPGHVGALRTMQDQIANLIMAHHVDTIALVGRIYEGFRFNQLIAAKRRIATDPRIAATISRDQLDIQLVPLRFDMDKSKKPLVITGSSAQLAHLKTDGLLDQLKIHLYAGQWNPLNQHRVHLLTFDGYAGVTSALAARTRDTALLTEWLISMQPYISAAALVGHVDQVVSLGQLPIAEDVLRTQLPQAEDTLANLLKVPVQVFISTTQDGVLVSRL